MASPRWRWVTPPDPDRTDTNICAAAALNLKDAIAWAISDPGSFVPRKVRGPRTDREYESVPAWGARAVMVLLLDRLDIEAKR